MHEYNRDEWHRACNRLRVAGAGLPHPEMGEEMEEQALGILGLARQMAGKACKLCHGTGQRLYPDTTTWRGGCGGQAITLGTCDRCWGSGRNDRRGQDLRALMAREGGGES
jgi:hypothetical protein